MRRFPVSPLLAALLGGAACQPAPPADAGPPVAPASARAAARAARSARALARSEQSGRPTTEPAPAAPEPEPEPEPEPAATPEPEIEAPAEDEGDGADAVASAAPSASAAAPTPAPLAGEALCDALCERAIACAGEVMGGNGPPLPPAVLEQLGEECRRECNEEVGDADQADKARACMKVEDCRVLIDCIRDIDRED